MTRLNVVALTSALTILLTGCGGSAMGSSVDAMPTPKNSGASYEMNSMSSMDSYDDSFAGFGADEGYTFDESEETYYETEKTEDYDSYDSTDASIDDNNNDTTGNSTQENTESTTQTLYQDKLVYRCNLEIETLNYDESYSKLKELINKYECRVESEYFSDDSISYYYDEYRYASNGYVAGKSSNMVIRVPSSKYNDFVEENGSLGNVTSKQSSIENITQEYYDTTAQVEGLKIQLNRLQEMLKQAYEVEDMIEINKEITEVQNQINKLTTHIRTMDMDTTYSYVNIALKEVLEYSEDEPITKTNTFVDRLKNQIEDTWKGFLGFLEGLLFTLIALIPTLVVIAIIWIVIRIIFNKKITEYKKLRKEQKAKSKSLGELMTYKEQSVQQPSNNENSTTGNEDNNGTN